MLTDEMSRHTTFRFCLDPTVEQHKMLARHAGAARFAFNQCLAMVKTALTQRKTNPGIEVPWSGFDLINVFNAWKKTEDAVGLDRGLSAFVVAADADGREVDRITAAPLADRMFTCVCGHSADRDLNAAANLARWAEQHHLDPRTPKQRGRAINARRRDGADQHPKRAGETSPVDTGTDVHAAPAA